MLDFIDKTFHQMTLSIQPTVVFTLFFGPLVGGNDRLHLPSRHLVNKFLARIATVGQQVVKMKPFDQLRGHDAVMPLTGRQPQAQRIAQSIDGDMNLGREPTPTASQRLASLTASFFGRRRRWDEPERWWNQSSPPPCRGHRRSGSTFDPKRLAHTSG